jgi:hypothetical protein
MSENFFKQQRQPITSADLDDDAASDEAMRQHLNAQAQLDNAAPQGPPPGIQMTGRVPPELQKFNKAPAFTPPQEGGMSEAQQLHAAAKRMLNPQSQQAAQQETKFNPEFTPPQPVQKMNPTDMKYGDFKDQNFESVLGMLQKFNGYDEVELPSKGKFYTRGEGPSNGILHIRRMKGHEEQILYTPRYVKRNQALNMVFKECIGEQINPDLLLSEDRTYLMIYLRGISHSQMYDVEIKCPDCTRVFQTQIDLGALPVDYCPDEFGPENLVEVLPTSGLRIRYRLATGRDDTAVTERRENRAKQWGDQVSDDTMLYRGSLLIEDIQGVNNKAQIQHLLENLPISDMAFIRELLNEPPFGVDTKVGMVCPHCAHEFETEMPMELSFFFPKPSLAKKKLPQA